jgi:RNA processing factor Prp31
MAGKKLMNITLNELIGMVEEQMTTVESKVGYVQNVYKIAMRLRINKDRGGDMTDILNEIRGIEGVTTVSHEASYAKETEIFNFSLFTLKFGERCGCNTIYENKINSGHQKSFWC